MKSALGKMIELENEEFWKDRTPLRSNDTSDRPPDNKENFLCSQFPMDIWTVGWFCCQMFMYVWINEYTHKASTYLWAKESDLSNLQ